MEKSSQILFIIRDHAYSTQSTFYSMIKWRILFNVRHAIEYHGAQTMEYILTNIINLMNLKTKLAVEGIISVLSMQILDQSQILRENNYYL